MKVEPLGDKVVVRRMEAEEQTAGGIVLPGTARDKPKEGRVLSVGDGRLLPDGTRIPHQVQEGDRVLFTSYAGTEVLVDSEGTVDHERGGNPRHSRLRDEGHMSRVGLVASCVFLGLWSPVPAQEAADPASVDVEQMTSRAIELLRSAPERRRFVQPRGRAWRDGARDDRRVAARPLARTIRWWPRA